MWWKWLLATGLTMLGGVLLVGLPGAILFGLSSPVLALLFGTGFMEKLPGDAAWPAAIGLTLVWPLGLWPLWWMVGRLFPDLGRWGKIGAYVGALYLWGALLSVLIYTLSRKG